MHCEQVEDRAFYAYTLEECLTAQKVMMEWLAQHPEDRAPMYELCSQLGIMTVAAQQERDEQQVGQRLAA